MDDHKAMTASLNEALRGLNLDAECVDAKQHRHYAFYDVRLGNRCRLSRLRNVSGDLALKIRSKSDPIIKPIRDLGVVRLQVVYKDPVTLPFEDLYQSSSPPKGLVPCLLGETNEGEVLWVDMATNPHMLVAGSTGSGKSVFLHTVVANAAKLQDCRLFLGDPKGVEFERYKDPALEGLVVQVSNEYNDIVDMLESLVSEMEDRYAALKAAKLSSIEQEPDIFPKILVVLDEVADLMLMDKEKTLQTLIIQLAQKCRAAGIYLVFGTQRPSADVMAGLAKANLEARLACRVSSQIDSRVVLDQPGAESLIGRGDAILKNRNYDMVRLQVAYTTPQDVVNNFKSQIS